jgi:FkbM family methyltransferase
MARIAALAASPGDRLINWLVLIWVTPQTSPRPTNLRLMLPSGRKRAFAVTDITQAKALLEVFGDGDYDVAIDGEVRTIFDLGANAGQSAVYFRDLYPAARIVSVEADPEVARLVARNMRGDTNHEILAAAVSDHAGTVTLARDQGHSWASRVVADGLTVPAVTIMDMMNERGIDQLDVLKIDIEGEEWVALTADRVLEKMRWVLGEVHPVQAGVDGALMIEEFRARGGFSRAETRRGGVFVLSR